MILKVSNSSAKNAVEEMQEIQAKVDILRERFGLAGHLAILSSTFNIIESEVQMYLDKLPELMKQDKKKGYQVPPYFRTLSVILGQFVKMEQLDIFLAEVLVEAYTNVALLIGENTSPYKTTPMGHYFIANAKASVQRVHHFKVN